MQEVRIYDSKGKLKKTISRAILEKRSTLILNSGPKDKKFLRAKLNVGRDNFLMALQSCYGCNKQISTKAIFCNQCSATNKKVSLGEQLLYSIALIYSILFWYFFHPFWTLGWVGFTRGTWITTSNFICGVIYVGGFYLWNKLFYRD